MKKTSILAVCIGLAGCATPAPVEYDGIALNKVVDAVQCELARIYIDKHRFASVFDNQFARTRLQLKVTNQSVATSSLTITPPQINSTITIPLGADLRDIAVRTAILQFDVQMNDLKARQKKPTPFDTMLCEPLGTGLPAAYSGLGLADWMASVASAIGRKDSAGLNETTYELEFTIERGANGGFTFKNVHVNLEVAKETLTKTNYNTLLVTFAPVKADEGGKKRATGETNRQLQRQIDRRLPLRLQLDSSGRLIQVQP